jgi:hypothetical protein
MIPVADMLPGRLRFNVKAPLLSLTVRRASVCPPSARPRDRAAPPHLRRGRAWGLISADQKSASGRDAVLNRPAAETHIDRMRELPI